MENISVGHVYEDRMIVEAGQTASLLNPGLPEVLGTSALVSFLQLTASKAIAPYLKPGQFTVGTQISLTQLASTPIGMEIKAVVKLERLDGRRIRFVVEAYDDFEKVCEGTHERYVIEIHWFKKRVEEKLKLKKAS